MFQCNFIASFSSASSSIAAANFVFVRHNPDRSSGVDGCQLTLAERFSTLVEKLVEIDKINQETKIISNSKMLPPVEYYVDCNNRASVVWDETILNSITSLLTPLGLPSSIDSMCPKK